MRTHDTHTDDNNNDDDDNDDDDDDDDLDDDDDTRNVSQYKCIRQVRFSLRTQRTHLVGGSGGPESARGILPPSIPRSR